MSASLPPQCGVEMFLVPMSIVRNSGLKSLSGDALALFIAVTYSFYRSRSPKIKMSLRDLYEQVRWAGVTFIKQQRNYVRQI